MIILIYKNIKKKVFKLINFDLKKEIKYKNIYLSIFK